MEVVKFLRIGVLVYLSTYIPILAKQMCDLKTYFHFSLILLPNNSRFLGALKWDQPKVSITYKKYMH
jgi:hypothetical protein